MPVARVESALECGIPFFTLGRPSAAAAPLGMIGGSLIFDSGEAEKTFVLRCQDRYLAYNALAGLQSLLFVVDEQHAHRYGQLIDTHSCALDELRDATGLALPAITEPLYVRVNLREMAVQDIRVPRGLDSSALCLNQVSPTVVGLVAEVCRQLRDHGICIDFDESSLRRLGSLAMLLHNKEHCWNLVPDSGTLPRRALTVIVDPEEFLRIEDWRELQRLYARQGGRQNAPKSFYVKSAQDSGGNVAGRLCETGFDMAIARLKREIRKFILCENGDGSDLLAELRSEVGKVPSLASVCFPDSELKAYLDSQMKMRRGIRLIVQPEIVPPAGAPLSRVGFSYVIEADGRSRAIAAAAQVYADADRHHYIGSYICGELDSSLQHSMLDSQIRELCRILAREGYSGPVNFDACRAPDGEFTFIGDLNPRLTAVYPSLAVRSFLLKSGLEANSILGLGYRGEFCFADIRAVLRHLSGAGILYTANRQRGVVLLPNIYREDGFDAYFVNVSLHEAKHFLQSGVLHDHVRAGCLPPHDFF